MCRSMKESQELVHVLQFVALGVVKRVVQTLEKGVVLDGMEELDEEFVRLLIGLANHGTSFAHKAHQIWRHVLAGYSM